MDLNLKNKLALVTGSTLGIGKAIAKSLLNESVRVVINGRNQEKLQETVEELKPLGEVFGIAADLETAKGADYLLSQLSQYGEIDILVNNVGFFEVKPFIEVTDDDWNSMFELNVLSGVRLSRAILPEMLKRNNGRIIFISSEQAFKPNPGMLHYAVSKTAQISLARGLAELTRGSNVTVNSVIVAPTWTEGVEVFLENLGQINNKSVEDMRTAYFETEDGAASLLQRFAAVEEIAEIVAFLCSPKASAINGAAQRVDGGIVRSII
jgi:NAD(P)-dependent dehydrogenase (short-subunit alcohol dehydrogenase family)